MRRYIARRVLHMVPVLVLLSLVVFAVLRLIPGDPVEALAGTESAQLSEEAMASLRAELYLDQPLPVQYALWLGDVFKGEWGRSYYTKRKVTTEILLRLPYTLQLGAAAWLVGILIGIPAGVFSALHRNSLADMAVTTGAMAGIAIPHFWLGIMLILLFGVTLGWVPTNGAELLWDNPSQAIRHMVLPVVTLATGVAAVMMRQTRSALLEVLREDYVRTARAKGLSSRRVTWVHALRNALLPLVTIAGVQVGHIIGGTVIVETMFSLPGIGRLAADSLTRSDYVVVQMVVMVVGASVLLANLVTDLLYAVLDPRVRYS